MSAYVLYSLGSTIPNPRGMEMSDCSAYGRAVQSEEEDYESMAAVDASSLHSNIYDTIPAVNVQVVT